jgi:hypothetical protein
MGKRSRSKRGRRRRPGGGCIFCGLPADAAIGVVIPAADPGRPVVYGLCRGCLVGVARTGPGGCSYVTPISAAPPELRGYAEEGGIVICSAVGSARSVRPGSELRSCRHCGAAVWITPDMIDRHELLGVAIVPLCDPCWSALAAPAAAV